MYLKHIVNQISCNNGNRALLILDNHENHVSMASIQLAKQNVLILLTIPPHTFHRLQPLDRSVFGPLKSNYNQAMNEWMQSNSGKIVTIYNIPALINKAYLAAFTPSNIQAGFKSTGIHPFCRDIFVESAFAPSELTNRSYLNQEIIETSNAQSSCQNQEDNLFSTISTSNHQSNDISYVLPSEILSISRAGPRKLTASGRKRGKTTILTDIPEKKPSRIHNILKEKLIKKAPLNKIKKLFHENSSDEEPELNVEDLCDDSSDYSEKLVHPVPGDYVLVSFKPTGKANPSFYIGLVKSIGEETGECKAKFLKKCKIDHTTGQPTFIFKEDDECSFPESDIGKILPLPCVTGTTSRQKKFVFPIILNYWNVY